MTDLLLPRRLDWLKGLPKGRDWRARLPELLGDCCDAWGLEVAGAPFPGGSASLVLPVRQGAAACVLKISYPDPESDQEAAALRLWDGAGAARLLATDEARSALLLERLDPGSPLLGQVDALEVITDLLPRLWVSAPGIRSLASVAAGWHAGLVARWEDAGRPCPFALIDATFAGIDALAPAPTESVLLHQDLHGLNILASERGWLAIDPKPLAGERAFSLAPIVRSQELGAGRAATLNRLDTLSERLGLDRERARLWTLVQTMAWGFGGGASPLHFEIAGWMVEA